MRNPEVHPRRRPLGRATALALLLGGCAAQQSHPAAAVAPPPAAAAPCVQPGQIPPEPAMVGSRFNGDAKHDLQVLAPNAKALRDWGQQLHALLQGCLPKTEAPTDAAVKP